MDVNNQDSKQSLLKQKLMADMKQAMKGGDRLKLSVLRMTLAAVQNREIAQQTILGDSEVLSVISKEAKRRRESIDAFKYGQRHDLVAQEEAELAILNEYLPQQIGREEIIAAARKIIEEVGAGNISDKGKVMPKLIAQLKGKADGREINAVVTELLNSY